MYKLIQFRKDHMDRIIVPKEYKLPDIDSPLLIIKGTIVDGNEVVAVGFIKLIGEAIIILNDDLPRGNRFEVISLLNQVAISKAKEKGLDEINVFIRKNKSFSNFLHNRFGYVKTGMESLVKRLWE